jgi:hypothetical protein
MTEFLKFGPNWLKNKMEGSSETVSKPIISQHRYAREEMLSLCERSEDKPELLDSYPKLYIQEFQSPLAFKPEEEKPAFVRPRTFLNSYVKNGNWRKHDTVDERKSEEKSGKLMQKSII